MLATRIARPIGQLVQQVNAITWGSYDHPIRLDAKDEIGYLAISFEQMRVSLRAHLAGLAEEKQLLQEANLRLQETQQQLLHLAARVAHEVNNPLAIVKTAIRIIRKQSRRDDPATENLQVIEEEINRIARIIREILAFSRPSRTDELVQVNDVIHSLSSLLEQSLGEKQIAFQVIIDPELPRVRISSDHLKQVILNLARNAEDAMPGGGQLVIRTARKGKGVALSVADTGCGIPQEHLGRLFDPFFTTKEKETERGMGFGLAVSYGIIRGVNGSIEVESEVGKGTAFQVSLPACEA